MEEVRLNNNLKSFVNWFLFEDRFITDRYNADKEFYSRLPILLRMCKAVNENFEDYNYENINFENLTENDFFSKIDLVSTFFKDINIDININELINGGHFRPNFLNKEDIEKHQNKYFDACCDELENNNYDILVPESNFTIDSVIMAHELGHYLNNTDSENGVYNFLSEVPSVYIELLYYDYLKNIGYIGDAEELQKVRFSNFNNIAKKFIPIIKVLDVYLSFGQVNQQNYNKLYEDDYEQTLNSINNTQLLFRLKRDLQYIIGFFMAINMRKKYKEDISYSVNFSNFNKNLTSMDIDSLLKILDIDLFDDNKMNVLISSIEEYSRERKQVNIKY